MRRVVAGCCSLVLLSWLQFAWPASASERSVGRSNNGFEAQLLFVTDKRVFDDLRRAMSAPQDLPVHVPAVNETTRMKELFPILVLSWGTAHAGRTCNTTYDLLITNPDGSEYGRVPDLKACAGETIVPGRTFLAAGDVGITIEAADPLGDYTVVVTVKDKTSGAKLQLSDTFTAK